MGKEKQWLVSARQTHLVTTGAGRSYLLHCDKYQRDYFRKKSMKNVNVDVKSSGEKKAETLMQREGLPLDEEAMTLKRTEGLPLED